MRVGQLIAKLRAPALAPQNQVVTTGGGGAWSVIPSSGTLGANGVLTLVTPLSLSIGCTAPGVFVVLPATALANGKAGVYWAVFSLLNTADVYGSNSNGDPFNAAADFDCRVPTTLGARAIGNGVAYTQTITTVFTVPRIRINPLFDGQIGFTVTWTSNATATAKTARAYLSNQALLGVNLTTNSTYQWTRWVDFNLGNYQSIATGATTGTATSTAPVRFNLQANTPQYMAVGGNLAAATDWLAFRLSVTQQPKV